MDGKKTNRIKSPAAINLLAALTAVTAFAMAYLLIYLVNGMSSGANAIDEAKTKVAVQSLVASIIEQSESIVTDNAKWDDAVTNVYSESNSQWLFDTWGVATAENIYDIAAVVDENGKTIALYSDGETLNADVNDFFGRDFSTLVSKLPNDTVTYATSSAILKTQKGIVVVTVAPVMPYTGGKTIPAKSPILLAMGKTLTPEYIKSLGDRLVLKDLKITSESPVSDVFVAINGGDGQTIGHMFWTPDRPGDKAKSSIQATAFAAAAAMIICMLTLTFVSQRLSIGLQKSEAEARNTANTDALTLLPNRHSARATLAQHIVDLNAEKTKELGVMLTDLDGFKEVNDSYGHLIGDMLLQSIGAGLTVIAERYEATLSRLGGDEFAFVVAGENVRERCSAISDAMLKFLGEPMNIMGRIARVGMSIGATVVTKGDWQEAELFRQADVAMYAAKANGKNQVIHYSAVLDFARNQRSALANHLREALAKNEIQVAYQPIVDAGTQTITGVEALARWQSSGEWIAPDKFISVAEEYGLIDELGKQVLQIACRQAAMWPTLDLSVNVSPVQFRNPSFVETLTEIVHRCGLPPHRLELEVTEGYIIEDTGRAKDIIDRLHGLGFQISLDDFGTGYSSIGHLRKFSFDRLKIDRSIVSGMIDDASARSIILATTSLATSLNMTVTAEGVESEEEAKLLRMAGCRSLQGYYFGRPQTAEAITNFIDARPISRSTA